MNDKILEHIDRMFANNKLDSYSVYYETFLKQTLVLSKLVKEYESHEVYDCFSKSREKLMDAYKAYIKGSIQSASAIITNYFFQNGFDKSCQTILLKNDVLYRASNYEKIYEETYDDAMFHLPFELREQAKNYRFSISGFPCLYLGDSVDGCVKELNDEYRSIAQYTLQEDISYYNLCFSKIDDSLSDLKLYYKRLLLIYAMSFSVDFKDDSSTFKRNYIISQLLTSAIASRLLKQNSINVSRCISYDSTKDGITHNYVFIPKYDYKKHPKNDVDLKKKFVIKEYKEI